MQIFGCRDAWLDRGSGTLACTPPLNGQIGFLLKPPLEAKLLWSIDGATVTPTVMPAGVFVRAQLKQRTGQVVLRAAYAGGGTAEWEYKLLLAEPDVGPVALKAASFSERDPTQSKRILREGLAQQAPKLEGSRRAYALADLAALELASSEPKRAMAHYRELCELAGPAGLLLLQAQCPRYLARLIFEDTRDARRAEAILSRHAEVRHRFLDEQLEKDFEQATYLAERGELHQAEQLFESVRSMALGVDLSLYFRSSTSYASTLRKLGLPKEADKQVREIKEHLSQERDPCMQIKYLNSLAWGMILARDQRDEGSLHPTTLLKDAQAVLDKGECKQEVQYLRACILLNQVRAELPFSRVLEHQAAPPPAPSQTERWTAKLKEAESLFALESTPKKASSVPLSIAMELVEMRARLDLSSDRPADAVKAFSKLLDLARAVEDLDAQWNANVGLGRSYEALAIREPAAGHLSKALAAYEAAELLLDQRIWFIPVDFGRSAFLSRFAAGTAYFTAALLRSQQTERALAVARRARVRGLLLTSELDVLDMLPAEQKKSLQKERADYWDLRQEYVNEVAQDWEYLGDTLARRETANQKRMLRLSQLFNELTARLRDTYNSSFSLPPLAPGTGLLLCQPLPKDHWVCFAQDAHGTRARDIGTVDWNATPAQLSAQILRPFADVINRVTVLRLLQSGRMQDIDFDALPWDQGKPLSADRTVVYALDVTAHSGRAPAAVRGRALHVSDPDLRFAAASFGELGESMRRLGWEVEQLHRYPGQGGLLSQALGCWIDPQGCEEQRRSEVRSALVLPRLSTVDLFQYDGHAAWLGEGRRRNFLQLRDNTLIDVRDVILLERVPHWVILSACEGGAANESSGQDDISIAQAFILRGSSAVIAAVQKIPDPQAADWSRELYGSFRISQGGELKGGAQRRSAMSAPEPDLVAAFHAAQQAIRERGRDWRGLRVLVP